MRIQYTVEVIIVKRIETGKPEDYMNEVVRDFTQNILTPGELLMFDPSYEGVLIAVRMKEIK